MNIDWMWVWWALTVALCAWKLIEGIFRPARMLEWPFIACAMWAYFYGYMGYQAKLNLSAYLGNGMGAIGQFVALLCLIGLLVGWSVGKRVRVSPASQQSTYSYGLAWTVAFCPDSHRCGRSLFRGPGGERGRSRFPDHQCVLVSSFPGWLSRAFHRHLGASQDEVPGAISSMGP